MKNGKYKYLCFWAFSRVTVVCLINYDGCVVFCTIVPTIYGYSEYDVYEKNKAHKFVRLRPKRYHHHHQFHEYVLYWRYKRASQDEAEEFDGNDPVNIDQEYELPSEFFFNDYEQNHDHVDDLIPQIPEQVEDRDAPQQIDDFVTNQIITELIEPPFNIGIPSIPIPNPQQFYIHTREELNLDSINIQEDIN